MFKNNYKYIFLSERGVVAALADEPSGCQKTDRAAPGLYGPDGDRFWEASPRMGATYGEDSSRRGRSMIGQMNGAKSDGR